MPDAKKDSGAQLADIPAARPGFDTLGMSAPVMMQMNTTGKWETSKPQNLDDKRLQAVVEHVVKSNVVSAASSYCLQCAAENRMSGGSGKTKYVPVIMMPLYSADNCPFDANCNTQKEEVKSKETKSESEKKGSSMGLVSKNKRGFSLLRLTDFDFLSQW